MEQSDVNDNNRNTNLNIFLKSSIFQDVNERTFTQVDAVLWRVILYYFT
jgi:hypothetical protein